MDEVERIAQEIEKALRKEKQKDKLFYLLPKPTQKKLLTPRRRCCICHKKIKWPDMVLYRYTKRLCKKCYREIVKGELK